MPNQQGELFPVNDRPLAFGFDIPFTDALMIGASRRVVLPAEFYGNLQYNARDLAFTISSIESTEVIASVLHSLNRAIENGQTFMEWRGNVVDQLADLTNARRELIFRNAVQTAYNVGQEMRQREDADERPFLMWDAINDNRTRPTHRAMDGHIALIDDPIWMVWSPPAGHNCRCSRIALTKREAYARGFPMVPPNVRPDPGFDYDKGAFWGHGLQGVLKSHEGLLPTNLKEVVGKTQTIEQLSKDGAHWVRDEATKRTDEAEFGYALDKEGRIIFQRMGGYPRQIDLSPDEREMFARNPGAVFIHSHPRDWALSDGDIGCAMELSFKKMVAVSHEGSLFEATFQHQPTFVRSLPYTVYRDVWRNYRYFTAEQSPWIRRDPNAPSPNVAYSPAQHIANMVAARLGMYSYSAVLSEGAELNLETMVRWLSKNVEGIGKPTLNNVVDYFARQASINMPESRRHFKPPYNESPPLPPQPNQ